MRIEINPVSCDGHGLCAELLPERITLDEWGYPLVDDTPLPPELEKLGRRAVRVCPTLALKLVADEIADLRRARAEISRARSVRPGRELRYQHGRKR